MRRGVQKAGFLDQGGVKINVNHFHSTLPETNLKYSPSTLSSNTYTRNVPSPHGIKPAEVDNQGEWLIQDSQQKANPPQSPTLYFGKPHGEDTSFPSLSVVNTHLHQLGTSLDLYLYQILMLIFISTCLLFRHATQTSHSA